MNPKPPLTREELKFKAGYDQGRFDEAVEHRVTHRHEVLEARLRDLDEIWTAFVHDPQHVEGLTLRRRNEVIEELQDGRRKD